MNKPPLHLLPAFVTAARRGNLTHAATQLRLTVSALSHQMHALEDRLGVRLFARTPRGVTLTAHGLQLLDAIAPHLDGIERAFARFRERPANALTLSALPSFSSSWLMPRLPDFMARNPGLEINLQTTAALVDFEREPVDAALRLGGGQWPGLTAEHLFDEFIAPVASPKLIAGLGRPKLGELARWPLLGESDDDNARWRRWFAQYGGTPPRRYAASFTDADAELLHKAAADGLGIALGRLLLARPLLDNGSLVALTSRRMPAGYGHYLVYPSRSSQHPALLAFRTWLMSQVRGRTAPRRKTIGSR
ncbi:MAG: LysR substrate-binding domain-containing protein [Rudaea sp.]|nr:LysR substrate-binding domain-containing protein [Rudaea sp.]